MPVKGSKDFYQSELKETNYSAGHKIKIQTANVMN